MNFSPVSENRPVSKSDLDDILNRLIQLVPPVLSFRNQRILLTGTTGFFGKWLTQGLLSMNKRWDLGNELILVSRDRNRALESSPWLANRSEVSWIECDIRRLASQARKQGYSRKGAFSAVIHGAATTSRAFNENHPQEMFDTIVEGTRQVLRILEASSSEKPRTKPGEVPGQGFILQFLSSGAIYGPQPSACSHLSESFLGGPDPLDKAAAYAEGKRAAEFLCASACQKLKIKLTIARCFSSVGPYLPLNSHFAAGNFINNVLRNEPISIHGDGTLVRSYLYSGDLVVWLLTLLLQAPSQRAYNVGSDQGVSLTQIGQIANEIGSELKIHGLPKGQSIKLAKAPNPSELPERYVPSIDRARSELGLDVWTSLPAAFKKTLQWHLGNREEQSTPDRGS